MLNRKTENVCHTLGSVTYLIVAIITHTFHMRIFMYITWVYWLYRFALDDV